MNNNESHRAKDDCIVINKIYKLCYSCKNDPKYASRIVSRKGLNLNELIAESVEDIDEDHPIFDVNIFFTGALNDLTRKEVGQILVNLGARSQNNVTTAKNYLILGENSYIDYIESNKKSAKLNKAMKYCDAG